jgi:glycosyltransferase involved in cell wall biosynthesis
MQAELPVVCTDIGGPPEVIADEELLCRPGDADALATAIKRAATADRDIGAANRTYVEGTHAPDVVVPQLVDLYEDLREHR